MISVGQAYAILQGRRHGDREEAAGLLNSMSPAELKEKNRQDAQAKGRTKPKKKAYKLGERLQVKRG